MFALLAIISTLFTTTFFTLLLIWMINFVLFELFEE
jgi:hypothetical protein